jgi:hypothetical protein
MSDLGPEIGFEAIGIIDSSLSTVSVWAKNNKLKPETVFLAILATWILISDYVLTHKKKLSCQNE